MSGALVASLPLLVLLVGLPLLMKPAVKVAPVAWIVTVVVAIATFGFPAEVTLLAAIHGALFGIFPIMYIPFGALVVYNTLEATGWMDKMQAAMAGLTNDRRGQALLIGFGFSAFLEGICGFGAPVAIPASILVGLGYDPLMAALVCLVANAELGTRQISMVNTMANAIVASVHRTVYPALAPVFGTIGVFLTGSNTSSNALFGNLQKLTAQGMGLSDVLMASAGSAGSTAGKMISPQSIVIAATAVGLLGSEGRIMRPTIEYTVPYVALLGLMVWCFAFVWPRLVP